MKNWDTLIADENKILSKHFTPGRDGGKIEYVVVHHNAANLSIQQIYNVWQTREASAHFQVDVNGRIGQLVHDRDTAWHAGNWAANTHSIGIEHADSSTSPWRISDATLENGAHLVAAVCKAYGLGRPTWMVNVFPHSHFQATSCPASIAGDQQAKYMERAQAWYDNMMGKKPAPAPATPAHAPAPAQGFNPATDKLDVDEDFARKSVLKWQYVMGTTQDGIVSGQLMPDGVSYSRPNLNDSVVRYGGGGSDVVRATQRLLKSRGLYSGAIDGLLGPATLTGLHKLEGLATPAMKPWTSFGPGLAAGMQNDLNNNKLGA